MKQPLKVLHVVIGLNMGGIQEFVLNLFTNIDKKKYAPIACVIEKTGVIGKEIELAGYEVIVLHHKRQPIKTIISLIRLIKSKQIDIIHAASYHPSLYARIAGILTGVKVIVSHEHGLYMKKRIQRVFLNKILLLFTDKFIAVSETMAAQVKEWYHYPKSKVDVIYNGVDTNRFKPSKSKNLSKKQLGLNPKKLVIGMICRLDPDKGHLFFLEAIKMLYKKYDIQWVIVGDGPEIYKKQIKEIAEKLGIEDYVNFLGVRRDVPNLLQAFDCFVLPTLREGFPISVLEAMSSGCAVIVSDFPSNLELVTNNKTGLIFPMKNSMELKNKIEILVKNKKLRLELGSSARKMALKKFSLKLNVKKIESLYEKIWKSKL
jgi:glycosyltransferase involved in cell wall biosynthesis